MIAEEFLVPYIITNVVSVGLAVTAVLWPRIARGLFVFLFLSASLFNAYTVLTNPEVYRDYEQMAVLEFYQEFIGGFFTQHTKAIVLVIAGGQMCIAVLLLFRNRVRRWGVIGGCIFLVAIAPLGVGSAFPSTIVMATGLWLMERRLAKSREDVRLVNRWNRFVYALWSPFYDLLINAKAFTRARGRAFDLLGLKGGDHVCLVGVGTGADFAFLPEGISAVGIDLSRPMLAKARKKLPISGRDITLECASAESLPYPDDSFDVAVLTLLISVAADGAACLREAVRVTRPGGCLLVFDKFLPPDTSPSFRRRLVNLLTRSFGTNINRSFEPMISGLAVSVLKDEPVMFSGTYRAILLRKDP